MMAPKSDALSEAPPTSAPSTLGNGEDLGRVSGLDRAAVKQAYRPPHAVAEARHESCANEIVDLADLVRGGCPPGADGPDGLIGDHEAFAGHEVGDGPRQLSRDDVERVGGVALGLGLAHADDDPEARLQHGAGLRTDVLVALAMIGAAARSVRR